MIVLDANALTMPVEAGVRLFDELERLADEHPELLASPGTPDADPRKDVPLGTAGEAPPAPAGLALVVPRVVVEELEGLAEGGGEAAAAASVGLDLAARCGVRETEADSGDDAVVELATEPDVTHAVTNDGPLQRRLLARDVPVIGLRGQHELAVTQP